MIFCGQCGLLLPPNSVACSRCGSAVTASSESGDQNGNAPTTISTPDQIQHTRQPYYINPEFVQEPNQFMGNNSQMQRGKQANNTPVPLIRQNTAAYPQSPPAPSGYTTIQGTPYPGYLFPFGHNYPSSLALPQKSMNWAMQLAILLLLFLTVVTAVVVIVGPNRLLQIVKGDTVTTQTTSAPPIVSIQTSATFTSHVLMSSRSTPTVQPALTPEQQAQSVIDHYYTAINNKDYQTAYNQWLNPPLSYQSFANGFANTDHDNLTYGNIVQQSGGTVQVNITIIAISTSSQQTTYQGYYIVGQQPDGTWKIISAKIHKV